MNGKNAFALGAGNENYEEIRNRKVFRTLYRGVRIPWLRIILGAFIAVFSTVIILGQYENYMALYQGNLKDLKPLWSYVGAIFLQYVVLFLCVFSDRALVEMVTGVQKKLWKKMMRMPVRDFESAEPGGMLSRITMDAEYAAKPFEAVLAFLQLVTGIMSLSIVMPRSADWAVPWYVVCLVMALVLTVLTAVTLSRSVTFSQHAKAEQTALYDELLSDIRFIKASNAEEKAIAESDEYIDRRYRAGLLNALYEGLAQLTGMSVHVALALCFAAAALGIGRGTITDIGPVSEVYAFLFAIVNVAGGFLAFPMYFSEAVGGTKKLASIFTYEEEDVDAGGDTGFTEADITLKDVSFAYRPSRDAVTGLDAVIPAGKVTAVVGVNGSGKTTLIKLIDRLYPVSGGEILLGDAKASETSLRNWRKKFAVVSQKTALFSGTVRDNIRYGTEDASEAEILRAAETAGLGELVAERGLDYDAGVAGSNLSGGEAQRVSIARALLRDPDYLILDEATANLDARTEQQVRDGVARLMKGRTVVVIAHDYAAVRNADNVIVMRDGKIEDQGPRDEMIARNPFMKLMVGDK